MKVTVELSDSEMAEILDLTGERKKGPAIRRLMDEALQQRRRAQIAQRFLSGEWGVELETYEADQEREQSRLQIAAKVRSLRAARGWTQRALAGQLGLSQSRLSELERGAGSFTASNWLYRAAPKDGTALGAVSQTVAIDEALKSKGVQFKAAEFTWIGRITSNIEVQIVSTRTKGHTLAGAREIEVPVASTGPGSPSDTYPKLMNEIAGTKFKIIRGFPGSTDGLLATERGEVEGALTSWNTMKSTRMNWITEKRAVMFVQYVAKRTPDLPDVPALVEFATNEDDRKLFAFAVSSADIGRFILGPPGISADRTQVLRRAFDATMKDPEFLAEIKKGNFDFEPLDGASLARIVAEAVNVDPKVIERMQKIVGE